MQIKSVIIDNIHYINFLMFNEYIIFLGFFFLIFPAEIGVRLIHQCIKYCNC